MNKAFKKKYRITNLRFHSKVKFKLPLPQEVQTTEKDFSRDRIPSGLCSQMQIGLTLLRDIFPLMAFQNSEFKASLLLFLCSSKLTTTLLEKDMSQCIWLFVSLLCSLEKKDCKEGKKERLPLHLFLEGCLLRK